MSSNSIVNNDNFALAQKTLDALWLRQKVISDNIANVDTPGYKAKSVEFESLLKQASESTSGKDLSTVSPQIAENDNTSMRADGNNVDIDSENIELARTAIQYEFLTRSLASDIDRIKYATKEGRG